MKIIQLELFALPPNQLLRQLELPQPRLEYALEPGSIRNIAFRVAGFAVSDEMIIQALRGQFLLAFSLLLKVEQVVF